MFEYFRRANGPQFLSPARQVELGAMTNPRPNLARYYRGPRPLTWAKELRAAGPS